MLIRETGTQFRFGPATRPDEFRQVVLSTGESITSVSSTAVIHLRPTSEKASFIVGEPHSNVESQDSDLEAYDREHGLTIYDSENDDVSLSPFQRLQPRHVEGDTEIEKEHRRKMYAGFRRRRLRHRCQMQCVQAAWMNLTETKLLCRVPADAVVMGLNVDTRGAFVPIFRHRYSPNYDEHHLVWYYPLEWAGASQYRAVALLGLPDAATIAKWPEGRPPPTLDREFYSGDLLTVWRLPGTTVVGSASSEELTLRPEQVRRIHFISDSSRLLRSIEVPEGAQINVVDDTLVVGAAVYAACGDVAPAPTRPPSPAQNRTRSLFDRLDHTELTFSDDE